MSFQYTGSSLRVKFGSNTIQEEIDFDFSAETEFQDLASKDTENDANPGKRTYSLSGNAYFVNHATNDDAETFFDWLLDQSKRAFEITDGVSGNISFSGNAFLQSFQFQGTNNEVPTYSFTLKCVGAVTKATNT